MGNHICNIKSKDVILSEDIMGSTYWLLDVKEGSYKFKYKLNSNQLKIIKVAMAMMDNEKKSSEEYIIYLDELMDVLEIKNHTAKYVDIPLFLEDLMKNDTFKVTDKDGSVSVMHLFDNINYNKHLHRVKFTFSSEMINKIVKAESNTMGYKLGNILKFNSANTITLYEVFKKELKNSNYCEFDAEIDSLKKWLALEDKYTRPYDFKTYILEKAMTEINEANIDLTFTYKDIKKGRNVIGFRFFVKANVQNSIEVLKSKSKPKATKVANKDVIKRKGVLNRDFDRDNYDEIKKYLNEPILYIMNLMEENKISALEATTLYNNFNGNLENLKRCYEKVKKESTGENFLRIMIKLSENFN